MKKILIVEDDVYIGNLIQEVLTKNNYASIRAYSGTEAIFQFENTKPDLVLLDLMIPGLTGEEVLEKIKSFNIPIIILSAKSSSSDKISNLLKGASDYITKPFDINELLARIEVQLRNKISTNNNNLTIGEITINTDTYEAYVNNNKLKLTKSEFSILNLLMSNPNHVFSRAYIVEEIWDCEAFGDEETIKVHVSNLRSKIKEYTEVKYIETVWGIGFKFVI